MSNQRPSIFKRKYIVDKKIQSRIAFTMILEVLFLTISCTWIMIYITDYYQGFIDYYITDSADKQNAMAIISKPIYCFLAGGVALCSLIFGIMGILISHKIAGPLYRVKEQIKAIIDGNYKNKIKFRKGDLLHDIADLFNEMTDNLDKIKTSNLSYVDEIEKNLKKLNESIKKEKASPDKKDISLQLNKTISILEEMRNKKLN